MIYLSYDHGGYELSQKIKEYLKERGENFESIGSDVLTPTDDYTVYSFAANKKIVQSVKNKGIYVCTTGVGSCIAANREPSLRAAVCDSVRSAQIARAKNNINVLVLGSSQTGFRKAKKIIDAFLDTPFDGGRHLKRVRDLTYGVKLDDNNMPL